MENINLELLREDFKWLLDQSSQLILDTLDQVETIDAYHGKEVKEIRNLFKEPLPEEPEALEQLFQRIKEEVVPNAAMNITPHFNSYVMTPGNSAAIVGDLISSFLNQNVGKWHLSPSATEIELVVIDWIRDFLELPDHYGGVLTSGGSLANFTGLNTGRSVHATVDMNEEGMFGLTPMITYFSNQLHSCVEKNLRAMGMGSKNCRVLPVDNDFKLDIAQLELAIEKDLLAGNHPFCVVGSAGTVNTGAVDDFNAIADICQKYGMWFHVDGAYGAPALSSNHVKHKFAGLHRADSIAIDPHKWLYVPYDVGCTLVKNIDQLNQTFSMVPDYVSFDRTSDDQRVDLMEYSLQLSRGFRALKVWMTFKAFGAKKIRQCIDKDLQNASYLESEIIKSHEFELVAPANLSAVCFRFKPELFENDLHELNNINQQLIHSIEKDGRVFVTGTKIKGMTVLRVCFVNHRTYKHHVDYMMKVLLELAKKIYEANELKEANF